MIKTQEDFFIDIYLPLPLLQGFEKGYSRFVCERELEIEHKLQYFDLHSLWASRYVFLVLLMLNRSPGVHSAGCWLSLLHVISIFSGPQLIRAKRPVRPDVAFPTTSPLQLAATQLALLCRTQLAATQLPSWLRYIIVQRQHDRPLDLWNRMFNRHQAEIAAMQFTGHSLPVHQSMSVSWALPCPISSANFRPRDFLS